MKWTESKIEIAIEELGRSSSVTAAAKRLSSHFGETITRDSLKHATLDWRQKPPSQFLPNALYAEAAPAKAPGRHTPPPSRSSAKAPAENDNKAEPLRRLFAAISKGPTSFAELCDKLDMSPGKTRALVAEAEANGVRISIAHDHVGITPHKADERIKTIGVPPVVGKRQRIAVISDLHLGSKYCLREQLREFVTYAYSQGVREVICPGDWLDGMYRHGIWELDFMGIDAQADDLFDTLPQLPGLNYRGITGNHDETFEDGNGIDIGHYIENRFRQKGRSDIHFYGRRSAFIRVGGAVIHLWHPRGSGAYAKSYKPQKMIEKYSSGEKPQILLIGHYHQYVHLFDRGVHAFLCPTFQGGGSAFGNSLGGAPAIGGLMMSWDLTEHGTMRQFVSEYRAYFEVEKAHDIERDVAARDGFPIRHDAA